MEKNGKDSSKAMKRVRNRLRKINWNKRTGEIVPKSKNTPNHTKKIRVFNMMSEMSEKNNGVLVHKKAREAGIHPEYIRQFKKAHSMEEIMPGIYSDKNMFADEIYALQQRYTKGIYSHETALYLWNMTDVIPMEYWMTFPRGYNNPKLEEWGIQSKYSPKDRYELGKTTTKTSFGNEVTVYNRERTLCELLQTRHNADKTVVLEAIKRYMKSDTRDLQSLMDYAVHFNVEDKLRPYLEVLM